MEVALRGGAVPEVDDGAGAPVVQPRAHGPAGGVEDLAGDRDRDHPESLPHGVGDPSVPRPPVEVHVLDEIDAAGHRHPHLAVGGKHEVLVAQGVGAPHLRRLLTEERRIDRQLALALQRGGLEVDEPGDDHQSVQRPQVLVLEVQPLGRFPVERAVRGQDPDGVVVCILHGDGFPRRKRPR